MDLSIRHSLCSGVGVRINSLYMSSHQPHELVDEFKAHLFIASPIEGGQVVDYSVRTAHRGGLCLIPKLSGGGVNPIGRHVGGKAD